MNVRVTVRVPEGLSIGERLRLGASPKTLFGSSAGQEVRLSLNGVEPIYVTRVRQACVRGEARIPVGI